MIKKSVKMTSQKNNLVFDSDMVETGSVEKLGFVVLMQMLARLVMLAIVCDLWRGGPVPPTPGPELKASGGASRPPSRPASTPRASLPLLDTLKELEDSLSLEFTPRLAPSNAVPSTPDDLRLRFLF